MMNQVIKKELLYLNMYIIHLYFLGTSHMPKPGTTAIPDHGIRPSPNTYIPQKKRKQYVPSKPITAFDEFLNELKLELHGISVPEITSIAYDRWNSLTCTEKERYEREALHANSDYVMDRFILEDDNDRVNSIAFIGDSVLTSPCKIRTTT